MAHREGHHRRGHRAGQQQHRKAFGSKHFSRRGGEDRRAVPGVAPDDHQRAAGLALRAPAPPPRWRATPPRGSSRPGRRAPVRAAPRCRTPVVGRTAPRVRRGRTRRARRPSRGSGSCAIHSSGVTTGQIRLRSMIAASRAPIRAADAAPAASTSAWLSGSPVMPGGQVCHQRHAQHLGAGRPGRDGLVHRRHAHQVGAQHPQHPDLRRRLVMRAGQPRVDAFGQLRVGLAGELAQPRRVRVGHVDELRADQRRTRRQVQVVADQHRLADGHVRAQPAGRVGQHDDARPGRAGRPHRVHDMASGHVPRRRARDRPAPARDARRCAPTTARRCARPRSAAGTPAGRPGAVRRSARRTPRPPATIPTRGRSRRRARSTPVRSAMACAARRASSPGSGRVSATVGELSPACVKICRMGFARWPVCRLSSLLRLSVATIIVRSGAEGTSRLSRRPTDLRPRYRRAARPGRRG